LVLKEDMLYFRKTINIMRHTLFLFCIIASFPVYGKKDFNGPFLGGGVGYGYSRADIAATTFKGMSFSPQVFYGHGWTKDQRYYGLEGNIGYDGFSKKKGSLKLEKSWALRGSFRFGKVIRSYFLPFVRIGFDYRHYKGRLPTKSSFGAYGIVLGLGVDAFIDEKFSIRSEFLHGRSLGFSHLKVPSHKKPLHSALTMSVSYHFS
jgi:hypothetical protein